MLREIFDDFGNFRQHAYDPYRIDEDNALLMKHHNYIFDEDGAVRDSVYNEINKFIDKHGRDIGHFADMVRVIMAQDHGIGTKGSYPAVYMWRHQ